jgi:hypothetical protein
MEKLPIYLPIVFILTAFLTLWFFYKASRPSGIIVLTVVSWMVLQAILSLTGFYMVVDTIPPRIVLAVLFPFLAISLLFLLPRGRRIIDKLDPGMLTLLHSCRILVEIVLFWLFLHQAVPRAMTFEDGNFDILSGLTAPLVYYFGFVRRKIGRRGLLFWNLICLGLLINILITAVLSAPSPFQRLAFNQPNIAILYFPYIWLPCAIVPLVLLSHLVMIRRSLK